MFKLPSLPSPRADANELADFAELLALKEVITSAREIAAYLGRLDDNAHNEGCDDDQDDINNHLDSVMIELERRASACREGYPFTLERVGTVLRHVSVDTDDRHSVYRYLLLATRLHMQNDRQHAKIDGSLLFEELAAHVIQCYLGSKRARSIVFGTAAKGGFAKKINDLCQALGEGGQFHNPEKAPVDENDDKLDTVTWVPFTDRSRGQLIVFSQCKTGSTWGGQTASLQPDAFVRKWMSDIPYFTPIRAFCIAESAYRVHWRKHAINAGLLFDRCRLIDFCEDLPAPLLLKIRTWTEAALESVTLSKNGGRQRVSRRNQR